MEVSNDVVLQLVKDSGKTATAVENIKERIDRIDEKLDKKASDGSVEGLDCRVSGLEDDLKPFRPVGKFLQRNTAFILFAIMVVMCYYIVGVSEVI